MQLVKSQLNQTFKNPQKRLVDQNVDGIQTFTFSIKINGQINKK
jgi:hypothetical protein